MTNQPDKGDAPPVDSSPAQLDPVTGLPVLKPGEPPKLLWYVVHTYSTPTRATRTGPS
jgi:hypothetical protein